MVPVDAAKIGAPCISVNVRNERACPQFAKPPESGMKASPLEYYWVSESGSCKYTFAYKYSGFLEHCFSTGAGSTLGWCLSLSASCIFAQHHVSPWHRQAGRQHHGNAWCEYRGGDILGSTSFQKGAEAHILLDLLGVQPTVIRLGFLCEMENWGLWCEWGGRWGFWCEMIRGRNWGLWFDRVCLQCDIWIWMWRGTSFWTGVPWDLPCFQSVL